MTIYSSHCQHRGPHSLKTLDIANTTNSERRRSISSKYIGRKETVFFLSSQPFWKKIHKQKLLEIVQSVWMKMDCITICPSLVYSHQSLQNYTHQPDLKDQRYTPFFIRLIFTTSLMDLSNFQIPGFRQWQYRITTQYRTFQQPKLT